ncbi:MAG: DUF2807 domain-containing protein [Bacteroidales bacterium]|nr:DUF2807 domain-containing protein [Bacteroidales bacterium]
MRKYYNYAVMALLMLSLLITGGCYKDYNCIDGNGNAINETRTMSPFHEVVCNGSYEVTVLPGNAHEVVVDAESNLIHYIRTSVAGGRLYLDTENNHCINNSIPVLITVYSPFVDGLDLNGSGSIRASGLYIEYLNLNISGSGNIDVNADALQLKARISGSGSMDINGVCGTSDLNVSGSGNIHAYGMMQDECLATISGSGNIYATVNQILDGKISGSGNIYYKGNPMVYQDISGSGRIIKQ